jgi:hypothetical protein
VPDGFDSEHDQQSLSENDEQGNITGRGVARGMHLCIHVNTQDFGENISYTLYIRYATVLGVMEAATPSMA